ncbi:MAG: 3-keto-5-aminohexanoate cleavage protein, partial [Pseudomonadota bacterium]
RMMTDLGVKPEIEAFDTGHLWYAKQLVSDGVLDAPALVQLCMGVPWGAPDDLNTFMAMVNNVPDDWTFSAFSLEAYTLYERGLAGQAAAYVAMSVVVSMAGLIAGIWLGRALWA